MNDKIGNTHFVETSTGTFMLNMSSFDDHISTIYDSTYNDWDADPISVGGRRVVPWGFDNNLPSRVRDLLEKNNLAPGILARKAGLLYGQGPMLYRYRVENNERLQEWLTDEEIQSWLDTWDYRTFIRNAITEYNNMNGLFVKYVSGKAVRLGRPWVNRLECLPSVDCLMEWPKNGRQSFEAVTHFVVGDIKNNRNLQRYAKFDKRNPAKHEVAVNYHCLRSFGRNFYAVSSFLGSIPWMKNANSLPQIIDTLNKNIIAAAYTVHVPEKYYNDAAERLRMEHPDANEKKIAALLDQVKDKIAHDIANVMAGRDNAGKFFQVVDYVDELGHKHEWRVEPIEMNIDKYIEALTKISRIADSSTTSGLGLNPSLANIIIDGKGDSGSQMLYALKLFYGADTQIPEEICLEAINDAIHINFPEKKDIYLGLYRKVINKEDNVTASKRTTNQV